MVSLRSEKANINHLIQDYIEDCQRDDLPLDDADAVEFSVVDEAQVVLVHIILEHEKDHAEQRDVWDECREDHGDGVGCQPVRHMIAQIISVSINKWLLVLLAGLF